MSDTFPSQPLYVLIATAGDRLELLERTLASLAACERPAGYREVVVIENGGDGGCRPIVERYASSLRTRYLHRVEGNKSRALNAALETVDEGLIVFADDDVRFESGGLRAYADASIGLDRGAYFGGPVGIDFAGEPPPDWLLPYVPSSVRGFELSADEPVPASRFLGFNWAAFATDIKSLGGFNPDRGPGAPTGATGQETDMQERLFAAGGEPRYVADARVWHWVPPEECSPEWALRRRYRHSITRGMQVARGGARGPACIGPVGVMVPILLRQPMIWFRYCIAPAEQRRFMYRHPLRHLAGLRVGFRHARGKV